MVGLSGQTQKTGQSTWITDVLTSCQPMTVTGGVVVPSGTVVSVGTDGTASTPIGTTGNNGSFASNCPSNEVVVGFEAWSDSSGNTAGVHGYKIFCSALNATGVPTGAITSVMAGIVSGTDSGQQMCPPVTAGAPGGVGDGYAGDVSAAATNRAGASSLWCGQVQVAVSAPVLSSTTPPSPSNSTTPSVIGSAPAGTSVSIYLNATCAGTAAATGSAANLASGIPVTVAKDALNSLSATASANGVTSPCSNALSYLEDSTAPTVTGAPTASPNANGWYSSDVSIQWTCADAGSGVATCPGNSTITGEGSNLSTTGTATDKAGNTGTGTVSGIKIDRTAPTSMASISGNETNGWYNTLPLDVTLSAQDNLSGVSEINYNLDGAAATITGANGTVQISSSGHHTLSMSAVDLAGNAEAAHSVNVDIDTEAPAMTYALTPAPQNSWNNTPVTANLNCSDQTLADGSAGSGVATCSLGTGSTSVTNADSSQTASLGLTTEGRYHLSGSSTDVAGNSADVAIPANVDLTPPDVTGTPDRAPDHAGAGGTGWYTAPVTVSFSCSDPMLADGSDGSGVASCPSPVTLAKDGANQSASGVGYDLAGNAGTGSLGGINIDQTGPTVSVTYNGSATKQAWYNAPVTVAFACADATSGVAMCPNAVTLSNEGYDQSLSVTAADNAGNTTPVLVDGVNIDLTPPAITGQITPAPNGDGWNNADVTVHWTCTDPTLADGNPGSGVASCPADQTVSAEGADQIVSGTATDNAGNGSSSTVTLNIDKTAPTLTGTPTTVSNADGWYDSPVTIHWTATDALSGVDPSTVPADMTIGTEGTGLTATASVSDLAGNSTTATSSPGVNIDMTPPQTSLVSPPSTWSNGPVTLNLTATDNLSGVAETHYSVDSGPEQTGTAVTISTEGRHRLSFYSVDNAGNQESANVVNVNIDVTAPTVTPSQEPAANPAGWNNTPVKVTFTCVDPNLADGTAGSGLAACTTPGGASQIATDDESGTATATVSSEGANQTVGASATDNAGNAGTGSATVSIDTTPPTIQGQPATTPDGYGWYNQPVTVNFACADPPGANGTPGSGIATCDNQKVLSSDGADQSVTGSAGDVAGNTNSATVYGINIDQTKPTITGSPTAAPNGANGWYISPVTVHFDVADALSGVDPKTVPADVILSSDGANQEAAGSVSDQAGNTASATVSGINIDQTPPTVTFSQSVAAPNSNGWYNEPVTVTFTCTDATSGVAAGSCPAAETLGTGKHAAQSVTVSDNAGNQTTVTVPEIDVDTVAPTITFTGNAGAYTVNQTVSITCAATDNLSGIDWSQTTCPSLNAPAYTLLVGTGQVDVLKATATDLAGNTSKASTSFTVGVTCSSLTTLVNTFSTDPNVAQGLDAKITAACSAPNANAKAGTIGAFDNQVRAQTGKALTSSQADYLTRFVGML